MHMLAKLGAALALCTASSVALAADEPAEPTHSFDGVAQDDDLF